MTDATESSYLDHLHDAESVARIGFAVLTISDTRDEATDKSGLFLREAIAQAGHEVHCYAIVKDDPEAIRRQLDRALSDLRIQVVITSGGTGIAHRDSSYEVVSSRLEKRLDGFGELFRALSYEQIGAAAMLSRAVGGTVGRRVLFALPGSTNAVRLGFERLIGPQVAHLVHELHKDLL